MGDVVMRTLAVRTMCLIGSDARGIDARENLQSSYGAQIWVAPPIGWQSDQSDRVERREFDIFSKLGTPVSS